MLRSIFFKNLRTRAQKTGPVNGPTSNRVGTQFSFDSLCIFAVAVLPTVADLVSSARWQLDPLQLPQVSNNEKVRYSADSYLEERKAEAACVRGASPGKVFES
jgi:hypothetical protein